ncbi:hypothetical protein AAFF_G00400760 [Aldrovandia affinis]|uniref:Uncharacterized protein n=1 Tax=Aldrovandia affinis TaxID=143900 RepID=A0AAD7SCF1_9TELE|nr:hypothetical protein AAFF_G00400760 [Aldrovandia affinis]
MAPPGEDRGSAEERKGLNIPRLCDILSEAVAPSMSLVAHAATADPIPGWRLSRAPRPVEGRLFTGHARNGLRLGFSCMTGSLSQGQSRITPGSDHRWGESTGGAMFFYLHSAQGKVLPPLAAVDGPVRKSSTHLGIERSPLISFPEQSFDDPPRAQTSPCHCPVHVARRPAPPEEEEVIALLPGLPPVINHHRPCRRLEERQNYLHKCM